MKLLAFWVVALVLVFGTVAQAAPAGDPAETTYTLYNVAKKHFGFSLESIRAEKEFLTPTLYARMLKEANKPVPKGDAPDIEGDLFFNSQESALRWTIRESTITDDRAAVKIITFLPGETRHITVLLRQVGGAWKIDDVDYGKDGKLTDQLK